MDKENKVCVCVYVCVYTHTGILLSLKEGNLAICNNIIGAEGHYVKQNMLSEISKTQKEKLHDLICRI